MSSPASRAEARRKAILSRGGDRLAKLTTSARGEDAPAYLHGDVPTRGTAAFVGEETNMPPPPPPPKDTPRPSPSPPPFTTQPDPNVWSEEQQRQFMQALMGGALNPTGSFQSQAPPLPSFATPPAADDPFAAMMAQLSQVNPEQGGAAAGKAPAPPAPPKLPSRLQKWMPLLHLVSMWCLLAFFVLWKEPQVFVEKTASVVEVAFWKRWPALGTLETLGSTWGVQVVPFFWAFMTLQVMLHSLRIFSGHNNVQPPALLSVALPHLPPPLPSLITNVLGYLRLGNAFMDDIAAIVFGIGMLIMITSWFAE